MRKRTTMHLLGGLLVVAPSCRKEPDPLTTIVIRMDRMQRREGGRT